MSECKQCFVMSDGSIKRCYECLEVENKQLKRPMECAGFDVDGMITVGAELIKRDTTLKQQAKRIKELEAENTLQRNALTWIIEEANSKGFNQSEIVKIAKQALKGGDA